MKTKIPAIAIMILLSFASHAMAQPSGFRPPAIPLATCDPYFSIWSFADHPGEDWPRHWTGKINALSGFVRIDGDAYRVLGNGGGETPAMALSGTALTPTRTVYTFEQNGVRVTLAFITPLLPGRLDLISRPATYVSWSVASVDGTDHRVELYFDNTAELVVNSTAQEVVWSRLNLGGLDVLSTGTREQAVLEKSGDDLRIDWGYFYLASPKNQNGVSVMTGYSAARETFIRDGTLPVSDDPRMPRPASDDWPVLAFAFDLGQVGAAPVERYLLMAYDDRFSIEYFYRKIRPYWRTGGMSVSDLLIRAAEEYPAIRSACERFDAELGRDLEIAGGAEYADLAILAYRQAVAAHKLASDIDGTPLLFPKENFSNGCVSTVDVIYPASPIFMLFNVDLLKASLTPVLQYAMMP
ncbi:MAG TPA: DUF5127 domain-containing protein, partial [Bacteroidota bacterium]|nr:DUF5127 domain-containing protein [Bacteroidota bacterium]